MKNLFFSAILIASVFSCKKETSIGFDNLIGNWENPDYTENTVSFSKDFGPKQNVYRLSIKSDGTLVERKNSGWCGTPPISYADFNGEWSLTDSTLTINVGYWGGSANYKWKIVSINNNRLTVEVLDQQYNWTNRE